MATDLSALVERLRATGGDTTDIEVKSAAGGLPESLAATLSALANMPGGGVVILGLDERQGFQPVSLRDPQKLKQGLAAKARKLVPPVGVEIFDGLVDGKPVVAALVQECDVSAKPCRTSTGKAYLRGYDGDYVLSAVEEQGFLAARRPPLFDRSTVQDASLEDLDSELVESFIASVRRNEPIGRGRFKDDNELLRRTGVIDAERKPTVAGILSLGVYPQQWFPRYVIQAAAEPPVTGPADTRARNQVTIDGPIPYMLDQALAWARRTFDTSIVSSPDGSVRDRYAYPLVAFRELIANALIHRDLDHWSAGMAVEVRLRRDRLVIGNPGGLYGITVERLGRDVVTSARNSRLVAICQHVYSAETGSRAIEALASGILIVTEALQEEEMPPAHFIDSGIRFVVVLRERAARPAADLPPRAASIYSILEGGPRTVAELVGLSELPAYTVRRALRALGEQGLVTQHGGRGRTTVYRRSDSR